MMYTMVDADGNIVLASYTTNSDAGVYEGHRLLPDNPPVLDPSKFRFYRQTPVPQDATEIPYIVEEIVITSEVLADEARADRLGLLLKSDWTQLADAQLSEVQKQKWVDYRQKLRDISAQKDFPYNIIWPEEP